MKDLLDGNPSDKTRSAAEKKAEDCLMKCADTHIALIPNMVKRIRNSMNCK